MSTGHTTMPMSHEQAYLDAWGRYVDHDSLRQDLLAELIPMVARLPCSDAAVHKLKLLRRAGVASDRGAEEARDALLAQVWSLKAEVVKTPAALRQASAQMPAPLVKAPTVRFGDLFPQVLTRFPGWQQRSSPR